MLTKYIQEYKKFIQSEEYGEAYKWEIFHHFEKNWREDLSNDNLVWNLNNAFHKSGANLWSGNHFFPLKMLKHFCDIDLKRVVIMFDKLYDESVSLEERMLFFEEESEKLALLFEPGKKLSHYNGKRAMTLWLTLRYPQKYYLFKSNMYKSFCTITGFKPVPKNMRKYKYDKLIGYFEFCDEIREVLIQDEELLKIHNQVIPEEYQIDDKYHLLTQDFIYSVSNLMNQEEKSNVIQEPPTKSLKRKRMNLNTILYGPPGTGKTYNSINYAVAIIEDKSIEEIEKDDYEDVKSRYNKYKSNGRIEFTTFHQSMSYEDFIEGIKPVMKSEDGSSDSGNVEYEIRNGLFKEMVDNANTGQDFAVSQKVIKIDPEKFDLPINKISLGNSQVSEDQVIYDYCMDNDCIALGFGDDIDFSGVSSKQEIRKRFKDAGMEFTNRPDFPVSAMERFNLLMKKGQLVFIPKGLSKLSAIGVVAGDYYFDDSQSGIRYKHFRKVDWLYKDLDIPIKEIYSKKFSQQTIYQMSGKEMNIDFFQGKGQNTQLSNYVLIIDEINRGNIAQIFGELITLLEPNKRAGEKEALETILPYSLEKFSVPSNLYVVGTMNTADRSVEALDTALRRRFSFVEMPPKPEIIAKMEKYTGEVDLVKMLKAINSRIERLLDKDHCIGHSYFLEIKNDDDLRDTFRDKVIPLLEEYFFGDLAKIGMVLGDSFVEESNSSNKYTLKSFPGAEDGYAQDMKEKKVFRIKSPNESKFKAIYETTS